MSDPIHRPSLLHLSWDSPDNPWCGGGGAFRDWTILEGLVGFDREVWTGAHPRGALAPDGCRRRDFGIRWLGEFLGRRSWGWQASRRLASTLGSNPDLLVSQSPSAWAPVPASLRWPRRILHVVHHVAGEEILRRLGPFGPSSLAYENRILSSGLWYATPNRATARRILDVNPAARIEIIPNGYTPPSHPPPAHPPEGPPRIAFLGRLDHRMKGLDRLLEAFAILARRQDSVRLLLAGRADRAMDAWLERALSGHPAVDRIEVVRNPDDEEKYRLLDRSHVFCVPSRFEGWCIAAIEAQSRGLPVVATRTDGTSDSVQDGRTGILVENDDHSSPANLAIALEQLITNHTLRREWGEQARTFASQFTWEAATASTATVLQRMREEGA